MEYHERESDTLVGEYRFTITMEGVVMSILGFPGRFTVALAALVFVAVTVESRAAVVDTSGGQITGVSGLVFGGTTYNVLLFDGSCVAGFSGCDDPSDFPFATQTQALDAVGAFLDVIRPVFNGAPISNDPTAFFGCDGSIPQCVFNLPYELVPGNPVIAPTVNVAIGVAASSGFVDLFPFQPGNIIRTADLSSDPFAAPSSNVYLQFVAATAAAVPLPATLPLFGTGLALLGFAGWRRRRAAIRGNQGIR